MHIVNVNNEIKAINTSMDFMRSKDTHSKCKRLVETMIATDFNAAQDDNIIMTEANEALENIILPEDKIREWRKKQQQGKQKQKEGQTQRNAGKEMVKLPGP